jgi:hypothetical protein
MAMSSEELQRLIGKRWLEPCGCPAMLLPSPLRRYWNGVFLPCADDQTEPELVLRDGRRLCSDNTFNFRQPRTDYDRLCAGHQTDALYLHPVGPGHALVIGHAGERFTGWWPAQRLLVLTGWAGWNPELPPPGAAPAADDHNEQELPDLARLGELDWSEELVWRLPSSVFYLMASVLHGLEPEMEPGVRSMWIRCRLQPGLYRVLSARCGGTGPPCLYRLLPVAERAKGRGPMGRSAGKPSR